ncbi:ABC transporter permease [Saccharibacillus sp. O23]|uniref:ABC transporter permease n=1 Tax=Saccharibacillus sp. O23 TaxID=2009338 RepID=UPI000B4E82CD|nr:FtsX-like permease family protein [Saccharibacillus sp. O23]OWR33185.1 ABC transporter permease [Saccharibacillus sp. O23]
MNALISGLRRSSRKQNLLSVLASALNLTVIGVFLMLVVELIRIREQARLVSRDEELMTYFTTLIAVSVLIVLFSLWIIRIVHLSLFQSRRSFNIQLRLAGISSARLSRIYMNEAWRSQLVSVPVALLAAEGIYHFIGIRNEIPSVWISLPVLLAAAALHLLTLAFCLNMVFRKIARFDPVEELRSPYKSESARRLGKSDFVKGAIGLLVAAAGLLLPADGNPLIGFLPLVGFFLMFDLVLVGIQHGLKSLARRFRWRALGLGQSQMLGYYRRIDPIFTTLIVGVMLSMGLSGMFETARVISRDTIEQNVYFQAMIVNEEVREPRTEQDYRDLVAGLDPDAQAAYGINLEAQDQDGVTDTIFGIDSDYLRYGEKTVLTDGRDFSANLDDPDFAGIYLPSYFVSEADVGSDYPLVLNGNTIRLTIAGRFEANGSRGRYGFVSKAHLQKIMGQEGAANSVYLAKADEAVIAGLTSDPNVVSQTVLRKSDLASGSYKNAIKGTEIFELAARAVILVSLLMLVHFLFASADRNRFDIGRLRAVGVPKSRLAASYLIQTGGIVTQSFLIGTLLAYAFIRAGLPMVLDHIDVPVSAQIPLGSILIAYLFVLVVGLLSSYFSIRPAFGNDYTENLTVGPMQHSA